MLYVYIFDDLHKNYVRGIKVSKIYVQKSLTDLSISDWLAKVQPTGYAPSNVQIFRFSWFL